jgi:hypothetical protein
VNEATDYEPHLLKSAAEVNFFWPYVEPHVIDYIKKTKADDITPQSVIEKLCAGEAFCFVVAAHRPGCDPDVDVKLVLVLEVVQYPQLNAMNIVLLAGEELLFCGDKFWSSLKGWAYMNGIRAIEALVRSEAMERLIKRLGFVRQAVFLRATIGE